MIVKLTFVVLLILDYSVFDSVTEVDLVDKCFFYFFFLFYFFVARCDNCSVFIYPMSFSKFMAGKVYVLNHYWLSFVFGIDFNRAGKYFLYTVLV